MFMRKTSIYLDDDLDDAIEALARVERISKAEAIRRAIRTATEAWPRARFLVGIGEGTGDVSENIDTYLDRDGFGTQ